MLNVTYSAFKAWTDLWVSSNHLAVKATNDAYAKVWRVAADGTLPTQCLTDLAGYDTAAILMVIKTNQQLSVAVLHHVYRTIPAVCAAPVIIYFYYYYFSRSCGSTCSLQRMTMEDFFCSVHSLS
jgi:hypothetical protein